MLPAPSYLSRAGEGASVSPLFPTANPGEKSRANTFIIILLRTYLAGAGGSSAQHSSAQSFAACCASQFQSHLRSKPECPLDSVEDRLWLGEAVGSRQGVNRNTATTGNRQPVAENQQPSASLSPPGPSNTLAAARGTRSKPECRTKQERYQNIAPDVGTTRISTAASRRLTLWAVSATNKETSWQDRGRKGRPLRVT